MKYKFYKIFLISFVLLELCARCGFCLAPSSVFVAPDSEYIRVFPNCSVASPLGGFFIPYNVAAISSFLEQHGLSKPTRTTGIQAGEEEPKTPKAEVSTEAIDSTPSTPVPEDPDPETATPQTVRIGGRVFTPPGTVVQHNLLFSETPSRIQRNYGQESMSGTGIPQRGPMSAMNLNRSYSFSAVSTPRQQPAAPTTAAAARARTQVEASEIQRALLRSMAFSAPVATSAPITFPEPSEIVVREERLKVIPLGAVKVEPLNPIFSHLNKRYFKFEQGYERAIRVYLYGVESCQPIDLWIAPQHYRIPQGIQAFVLAGRIQIVLNNNYFQGIDSSFVSQARSLSPFVNYLKEIAKYVLKISFDTSSALIITPQFQNFNFRIEDVIAGQSPLAAQQLNAVLPANVVPRDIRVFVSNKPMGVIMTSNAEQGVIVVDKDFYEEVSAGRLTKDLFEFWFRHEIGHVLIGRHAVDANILKPLYEQMFAKVKSEVDALEPLEARLGRLGLDKDKVLEECAATFLAVKEMNPAKLGAVLNDLTRIMGQANYMEIKDKLAQQFVGQRAEEKLDALIRMVHDLSGQRLDAANLDAVQAKVPEAEAIARNIMENQLVYYWA